MNATEAVEYVIGNGIVLPPRTDSIKRRAAIKLLKEMLAALKELRAAHENRRHTWDQTVPGDGHARPLGKSKPDPERKAAGYRRAAALRRCLALGK